jgi:hypothetical protein
MSPRFLFVLSTTALACSVEPDIATFVHRDGPRAPLPLQDGDRPPPALVAMAHSGEVVVIDPASGQELGRSEGGWAHGLDLAAGSFPQDGAAWIALRSRDDAEEPAGDLFAAEIDPSGSLGPARRLGRAEGETSVVATPFGVVVSQEDLGERWRLVPYAGGFTKGLACGRPLSVRTVAFAAEVARYEALSFWPEGELSLLAVEVEAAGVTRCDATRLAGHPPVSDGVRLVDLGPGFSRAIVDITDGALWIGALDGEQVVSRVAFAVDSSRLESVTRFARNDGSVELVAVGAEPARVVWAEVGLAGGGQLELVALDVLALAGDVSQAERAPSRVLAVSPPYVFVSTTEGVESFGVDRDQSLLEARSVNGSLAGPLAAVTLP